MRTVFISFAPPAMVTRLTALLAGLFGKPYRPERYYLRGRPSGLAKPRSAGERSAAGRR